MNLHNKEILMMWKQSNMMFRYRFWRDVDHDAGDEVVDFVDEDLKEQQKLIHVH